MYKIAFVYVYYTYYFFGKLILNSVVWMVFRFFEHHPTIFDYRVGLMASDVKIVEIFFWPSGVLF